MIIHEISNKSGNFAKFDTFSCEIGSILNITAPETISRSRDMIGAHKNFNGSRDLTTPLSGMVCHPWASIAIVNLPTKFKVSISTLYKNMMSNVENGVVWGN